MQCSTVERFATCATCTRFFPVYRPCKTPRFISLVRQGYTSNSSQIISLVRQGYTPILLSVSPLYDKVLRPILPSLSLLYDKSMHPILPRLSPLYDKTIHPNHYHGIRRGLLRSLHFKFSTTISLNFIFHSDNIPFHFIFNSNTI